MYSPHPIVIKKNVLPSSGFVVKREFAAQKTKKPRKVQMKVGLKQGKNYSVGFAGSILGVRTIEVVRTRKNSHRKFKGTTFGCPAKTILDLPCKVCRLVSLKNPSFYWRFCRSLQEKAYRFPAKKAYRWRRAKVALSRRQAWRNRVVLANETAIQARCMVGHVSF